MSVVRTIVTKAHSTVSYFHDRFGFTEAEVNEIMTGIYARGDRMMTVFLVCHFVLALLLASFYDTWLLSI